MNGPALEMDWGKRLAALIGLDDAWALHLPLTKKAMDESGRLDSAQRRVVRRDIASVGIISMLKPEMVRVPAHVSARRRYEELALVHASLKAASGLSRAEKVIHRVIPYPVLLVCSQEGDAAVSFAPKRTHKVDAAEVVIESIDSTGWLGALDSELVGQFLRSLAPGAVEASDLHALYEGWRQRLVALQCAIETGSFVVRSAAEAEARRLALARFRELQGRIGSLRSALKSERSFAGKLELNTELSAAKNALQETKRSL